MAKQTKPVHCDDCSMKPSSDSAIGKSLSKVYGGKYERWLRSYGLKPSWEIYPDSVEIYVWHGYRPNPSSWSYLLKSVFYPTNETLNIWTHFIPFLLMTYRTYCIFTSLKYPTDYIYCPFWVHSFACCNVLLLSALAHTFCSKSAHVQEFCMCCDYSGIVTFGITNVVAFELYACPTKCIVDTGLSGLPYIYLMLMLVCLVYLLSCISRHPNCPKPYILRFAPSTIYNFITAVPSVVKCYTCIFDGNFAANPRDEIICSLGSRNFVPNLAGYALTFFASIVFSSFRFPEKYYPGWFDTVGCSHQIFHIFIALGLYAQNVLMEHVLRDVTPLFESGELVAEDMAITKWTTIYPITFFAFATYCFAWKFSKFLSEAVQERRNKLT